jgi:hypothetical protein
MASRSAACRRTAEALEHLGRVVAMPEPVRAMAAGDSDIDPIRGEPAFRELVA